MVRQRFRSSRRFAIERPAGQNGSSRRSASIAAGAAMVLSGWWFYRDYRAWRKLGSGGLPGTFRGWVQTSIWRLQKIDPLDLVDLRKLRYTAGDVIALSLLPARLRRRPRVAPHPVPHRQLDQRAAQLMKEALQTAFDRAVAESDGVVRYALSHFERHTEAITSCGSEECDPIAGLSQGEIAHIHALDGSMHMILSPSDALTAIEARWAERHGLAGRALGLPPTYLLVYAPETMEDVAIASRLLAAAIVYMTGREATAS